MIHPELHLTTAYLHDTHHLQQASKNQWIWGCIELAGNESSAKGWQQSCTLYSHCGLWLKSCHSQVCHPLPLLNADALV
jgi:hypothetical protein